MRALFATSYLIVAASVWAMDSGDSVLLASRRAGLIEAFSLETLKTTSRIRLPSRVEHVASDPSGNRLFVALPLKADAKGCCALFALDLRTLQATFLVEPALVASATMDRVLTQRGNVGIEIFDSHSLIRLPTMKAPGVYQMRGSPSGRWLAGTTTFPSPSLDLFDLTQGTMVWRAPFEEGQSLTGAWIGEQYYLFSADPKARVRLWLVKPDHPELSEPLPVSLPETATSGCKPVSPSVLASGDRLVIFEGFGGKLDRRRDCPNTPGGYALVDPKTGVATNRLAPSCHFSQLVGGVDGRYLYGLDVGDIQWEHVRVVKLDAVSGAIVGTKKLQDGVWFLTSGIIPQEIEGHLDLTAIVH
jgi:hypothetical protein